MEEGPNWGKLKNYYYFFFVTLGVYRLKILCNYNVINKRKAIKLINVSHLTNFPSFSVFMYMNVACFFLSHFAFEKESARFEM